MAKLIDEKPLRAKRCENCCKFDSGDPPRTPSTCRANLPNLLLSPGSMGNTGIAGVWVPVRKEDWCAHHATAPPYEPM